ncbi:hypothetical protein ACHMW6_33850 [Pseudoduganella sp. UC29_106]|uniref:polysaccharide deacetylase family protein n=1 Tax=Pseudoduganella sp. UC29_106 TaxID=3374553 RepID=UPI0037580086
MLDVFITVDVEIWCNGWKDIDSRFPDAYRRYIHGPTASGEFGLPYQLRVLSEHGLTGVFFVEPLFAARFGRQPLADIVGMIRSAGHEVQLHLHPEWIDEARQPLLQRAQDKRQHLGFFSLDEQTELLRQARAMLVEAGAADVNAFRAGSFGFNRDTLLALAANGIPFDSSYNATMFGPESGVMPGMLLTDPVLCDGVAEYPMTVYRDGRGLRHTQLTSCTSAELEGLLWQALEQGREAFVLLSHGFELLNTAKTRSDPTVVERFQRLCGFLERNRDSFRTAGFAGRTPTPSGTQHGPLTSPLHRTGWRMLEQAYRRRYG